MLRRSDVATRLATTYGLDAVAAALTAFGVPSVHYLTPLAWADFVVAVSR
jgi:hypothetical protein